MMDFVIRTPQDSNRQQIKIDSQKLGNFTDLFHERPQPDDRTIPTISISHGAHGMLSDSVDRRGGERR